MDAPDIETVTLLQRRKKSVQIGKTETLLILRSYVANPTKWGDIVDNIRQNVEQLPPDARQLYQAGTAKQLRDRMSGKLGKLIAQENIADVDIREAVLRVKELERRLVRRHSAADVAPAPLQDITDNVAAQMSDLSDEEQDDARADNQPPVPPQAGMNEQHVQEERNGHLLTSYGRISLNTINLSRRKFQSLCVSLELVRMNLTEIDLKYIN